MESILKEYFGFENFRTGQKEIIDKILNKESAIAIFATGKGKSLCYQFSALKLENLILVVSPLMSLMQDQLDFLKKLGIPAAKIDSTLSKDELIKNISDAKKNRIKILMISPERFKNEFFRVHLKEMKIDLMVVDEAHSISEWGHNFRPDYLKLPHYKKEYGIKNVLLLTATATPNVIKDMSSSFGIPNENIVITGFYRNNLDLNVVAVENENKDETLYKDLKERFRGKQEPTIVYVTQQKTADKVAEFLNQKGISAYSYHAGKDSKLREEIQNYFMKSQNSVIVATIAFGMGIDKSNIRNVYHYNLPKSLENYAQEIGRAGRDGEKSFCKVLASKEDLVILKNFIYGDFVEKLSIEKIISDINENQEDIFEIMPYSAGKKYNMKILPLKTLIVYLEMQGILEPLFSSFKTLQLKFLIEESEIENRIIETSYKDLMKKCIKYFDKKIKWYYLDIEKILENEKELKRNEIMEMIVYLEEEKIIEYQQKDSFEAYRILKRTNNKEVVDTLHNLFRNKVVHEIKRLDMMVDFFQSDTCLNYQLASYFGEKTKFKKCGHCSVCLKGSIVLPDYIPKKIEDLENIKKEEFVDYKDILGEFYNALNIAKILSGTTPPVLGFQKNIKYFGQFEYIDFANIFKIIKSKFIL